MAKYIPLILFTVLTNAAAQIVLKQGMLVLGTFEFTANGIGTALPRLVINPYFLLGLVLFVVSLGSHLLVLSRVDLSFAYPFLSLAYVVVLVCAYLVFDENLNFSRICGIVLICIGTIFISRS